MHIIPLSEGQKSDNMKNASLRAHDQKYDLKLLNIDKYSKYLSI